MTKSSYREPDYAFGQRMLTLRLAIGLTQAGLADHLGVSRHAVGGWETGQTYPTADHLKHLITLALQQHAFAAGHEAAEIRDLWRAAHQKVLLDERWLHALLSRPAARSVATPVVQTSHVDSVDAAPTSGECRLDWGDALDVPTFYGRAEELALLSRWVVAERCRVVSVLGMGGVGKSALAVTVMHRVAPQFAVVIWRSLRDAPACDALVADCLQVLAPHALRDLPDALDGRLRLLMEQLRERRVLLVLDNLEMLLEEGTGTGRMRAGFEGYARLLRRIGETAHRSCLLLTSREKPAELVPMEGTRSPVRAVRLGGLDADAGGQILVEKDVAGSPHDRARLVEVYGGNPLALKIVAQSIVALFGGEIVPFLEQGEVVFGGVRELLDEQVERREALEQRVFFWLAILREPVLVEDLRAVLSEPWASVEVLEALDGLHRRNLIERGQRAGSFTLQSVVLEYATARLIAEASREIEQGHLERLIEYGLCQAYAKEYVRQVQERLLLDPLLTRLESMYPGQAAIETRCRWLLDQLRGQDHTSQGYGPANLVALLRLRRKDLRRLNLSRLALRGVFLHGIAMQDTDLSHTVLRDSVVTDAFDDILGLAISPTGTYWAAVSRRGKIQVWEDEGRTLRHGWQAYVDVIWHHLAFSPDGRTLATGGTGGGGVKLWDVITGTLLWSKWLTRSVVGLAFSPNGRVLAIPELDGAVRLWDAQNGTLIADVPHPGAVYSLAWSPDGQLLASGDAAGTTRLWRVLPGGRTRCVHTLVGHTNLVLNLAFSPDGAQLASASFDSTVKLWDVTNARCLHTFTEHTACLTRVAWSPDGRTLASAGFDHMIWLQDIAARRARAVLQGHTASITGLAFTPDSRTLLSGSDDGTVKVWDVDSCQCVRTIGGHVTSLVDIDWSPDGTQLASGGTDTMVTLWDAANGATPRTLRGHQWIVLGVTWHPGGHLLASSGQDNSIRVWDAITGALLHDLRNPDGFDTVFQGVAWSPDGRLLACGSFLRGVQVWEMTTRTRRWISQVQPGLVRNVAWSPDGVRVAGGGDDGTVYMWDANDGSLLQRLAGHDGAVMRVAWSRDGRWLASVGGRAEGELYMWDAQSGKCMHALPVHQGVVAAVAWSPHGDLLISGGSDGTLRWWDIQRRECLRVQSAHQGLVQALKVSPDGSRLASCGDDGAILLWDLHTGEQLQTLRRDRPYERMDITGLTGITAAQRASLIALGAVERVEDG